MDLVIGLVYIEGEFVIGFAALSTALGTCYGFFIGSYGIGVDVRY